MMIAATVSIRVKGIPRVVLQANNANNKATQTTLTTAYCTRFFFVTMTPGYTGPETGALARDVYFASDHPCACLCCMGVDARAAKNEKKAADREAKGFMAKEAAKEAERKKQLEKEQEENLGEGLPAKEMARD